MLNDKKKLVNFLKENNAFGVFVLNFDNSKQWRKENGEIYDEHKYFTNTPCERYISGAFLWRNTVQGHIFWEKLSETWKKLKREYGLYE